MDTDLSHEALDRFSAIEARLDALEGAGPVSDTSTFAGSGEEDGGENEEENEEEV